MKKLFYTIVFCITICNTIFSQPSLNGRYIDVNNIKARINPAGDLFWDFNTKKAEAIN